MYDAHVKAWVKHWMRLNRQVTPFLFWHAHYKGSQTN